MNKIVKRVALFFVGVAVISWASVATVQAYDEKPAQLRVIVTGLGQPLPGSSVTVAGANGEETGETASNGQIIFELIPGHYTVSVEGTYGGSDSAKVSLFEDELRLKAFELGLAGALPHGDSH
ncbi:MAG: hypothetical protein ACUZ8O_04570 [Candidatus Anammoxibacter sp.]